MNKLDKQYQDLLQTILDYGVEKKDRTGTGTKSIFGYTIRHNMKDGFPVLTTKKMAWKTMVTELLWFLRGDTNIKFLVDNGCHIWDGDAYKNYTKLFTKDFHGPRYKQEQFIDLIKTNDAFARDFGDLGPIYGKQWRKWKTENYSTFFNKWGYEDEKRIYIDQIANLINDLKTNPDSRRLMVTAWNPADLEASVLPPCHYGFQVYTRELSREERIQIYVNQYMDGIGKPSGFEDAKLTTRNIPTRAISLMWNQRSVDTGLGLSFNVASYSLLLMMIAKQINMVPDEVIGNLGDVHLYLNHIEPIKEQLTREPYPLPTVKISDRVVNDISEYTLDDITLENYQSHPTIKMPLSN
jgi:thymidylate synthase